MQATKLLKLPNRVTRVSLLCIYQNTTPLKAADVHDVRYVRLVESDTCEPIASELL